MWVSRYTLVPAVFASLTHPQILPSTYTHTHTHTPSPPPPLCQVSKLEDGSGLISSVLSGHVSGRDQLYSRGKPCSSLSYLPVLGIFFFTSLFWEYWGVDIFRVDFIVVVSGSFSTLFDLLAYYNRKKNKEKNSLTYEISSVCVVLFQMDEE